MFWKVIFGKIMFGKVIFGKVRLDRVDVFTFRSFPQNMRLLFLYTYLRFKSIFYSQIVCTVVTKKVFRQKYFVTCGCNRVHLPSPYSDGGADCHSKKTRPGANIFFYISFLCYKEFHGTIQFPKPPFSAPKKKIVFRSLAGETEE